MAVHADAHEHLPLDLSPVHGVFLVSVAGAAPRLFVVFCNSDMAEIDQIGLPCVGFPGDIAVLVAFKDGFIVACSALTHRGDSLESPVFVVAVAIFTAGNAIALREMRFMAEGDRLFRLIAHGVITAFLENEE